MYLIMILLSLPLLWAGALLMIHVFKGSSMHAAVLGFLILAFVSSIRFNTGYESIYIDLTLVVLFVFNSALCVHLLLRSKLDILTTSFEHRKRANIILMLSGGILFLLALQGTVVDLYDISQYAFHVNVYVNLFFMALMFYCFTFMRFQSSTFMKIIAVYSLFNSFLGVFQYIFNRSFLLFSTSENINYYEGAVVSKRVFGFVGASNGAGNLGAILFSVLLYYFIKKRNFLSLSALLMNLVFVLLTFTRIGYLSICIQMLVYLVSSHKGNIHHWLKRCLIGIATILAAFIAFQVFYKDIYQVLFVDRGDTQSNRFSQFSEAIIVMKDHPWFGIGAGQYVSYVENHYGLEDIVLHSQFLNILIEQGIFSFALFLLIYFLLFIWSLKVYKGEAWFPVSLMLGNFITVNFNPNQYYSICIYTFFILAYGMIFLGKSDDRNEAELDRRLALFNENFTRFPGTATLPNRWSNEILPGSNADTARIDA